MPIGKSSYKGDQTKRTVMILATTFIGKPRQPRDAKYNIYH